VGSTAFKAAGTGDPRSAGSIPVHLRQEVPGHSTYRARLRLTVVTDWSRLGEEGVGTQRRLLVVTRHDVRVDLERDADVGVADAL
jgi:hypothetical protein